MPLVGGIAVILKSIFNTYKSVKVFKDAAETFAQRVLRLSRSLLRLMQQVTAAAAPPADTGAKFSPTLIQAPPELALFRSLLSDADALVKVRAASGAGVDGCCRVAGAPSALRTLLGPAGGGCGPC